MTHSDPNSDSTPKSMGEEARAPTAKNGVEIDPLGWLDSHEGVAVLVEGLPMAGLVCWWKQGILQVHCFGAGGRIQLCHESMMSSGVG